MSDGRFNGLRAAVEVWVRTPAWGIGSEAFNALGRDMLAALDDRDRVREAARRVVESQAECDRQGDRISTIQTDEDAAQVVQGVSAADDQLLAALRGLAQALGEARQ